MCRIPSAEDMWFCISVYTWMEMWPLLNESFKCFESHWKTSSTLNIYITSSRECGVVRIVSLDVEQQTKNCFLILFSMQRETSLKSLNADYIVCLCVNTKTIIINMLARSGRRATLSSISRFGMISIALFAERISYFFDEMRKKFKEMLFALWFRAFFFYLKASLKMSIESDKNIAIQTG